MCQNVPVLSKALDGKPYPLSRTQRKRIRSLIRVENGGKMINFQSCHILTSSLLGLEGLADPVTDEVQGKDRQRHEEGFPCLRGP